MTSRLYRTTQRLFQQVFKALRTLGLAGILSPLSFGQLAIYVTGLLLLDRRQNGARIARWLPVWNHDGLNRFLCNRPFSSRAVMRQVIGWAARLGQGYLALDDVVVEKRFSKLCNWMGWTWSSSLGRKVHGFHIVLLLWCSGRWRIPVAFRLWRPKEKCAATQYRTKSQLAWEMIVEVHQTPLCVSYIAMDTHYSGGWLTKKISRLGLTWIGVLHPNTIIIYQHRRWNAKTWMTWFKLKWRSRLELRAKSIVAYLPKYGHLRLVVTKNRHGNCEILATNDRASDLTKIVLRKRSRWAVETLFRDAKQFAGLAACQCRSDQSWIVHVTCVLLAFILLQRFCRHPKETLGEVKERLQREVFTGGLQPQPPLRGKVARTFLTA